MLFIQQNAICKKALNYQLIIKRLNMPKIFGRNRGKKFVCRKAQGSEITWFDPEMSLLRTCSAFSILAILFHLE